MRTIAEGRLAGVFEGYDPERVFRLDKGETCEQVGPTVEHIYRERPPCRLVTDGQRTYLDVEGTSGVAEVRRYLEKRWAGPGPIKEGGWPPRRRERRWASKPADAPSPRVRPPSQA